MHAQMVIGEAISDDAIREFTRIYLEVAQQLMLNESGFLASQLLHEEGSALVVTLTTWMSREECLRYHASRAHRVFIARTQPLLIGSFVSKLFERIERLKEPNHPTIHEKEKTL